MDEDTVPLGHRALRVNQIDASDCDNYIFTILTDKLLGIFKYLNIPTLADYRPEIEVLVKTFIWNYSLRIKSATPGQALYSMSYTSLVSSELNYTGSVSKFQSGLYFLCTVALPWTEQRISKLKSYIPTQVYNTLHLLQAVLASSRLINYLIFLTKGQYLYIYERVLGIRTIHKEKKTLKDLEFGFSTREIMWHGFSEFVLYLLPMINFKKWKLVLSPSKAKIPETSCALCHNSTPTNAHHIKNCYHHTYCYHCAAECITREGHLGCEECSTNIKDLSILEPNQRTKIS